MVESRKTKLKRIPTGAEFQERHTIEHEEESELNLMINKSESMRMMSTRTQ